jgi:hypothetical protein
MGIVPRKRPGVKPPRAVEAGLRRVAADPTLVLSKAVVDYAHDQGWLTPWEWSFYLATAVWNRLSRKQMSLRAEIKRKVLASAAASGKGGADA